MDLFGFIEVASKAWPVLKDIFGKDPTEKRIEAEENLAAVQQKLEVCNTTKEHLEIDVKQARTLLAEVTEEKKRAEVRLQDLDAQLTRSNTRSKQIQLEVKTGSNKTNRGAGRRG